jgi:hypothetical protein
MNFSFLPWLLGIEEGAEMRRFSLEDVEVFDLEDPATIEVTVVQESSPERLKAIWWSGAYVGFVSGLVMSFIIWAVLL